MSFNPAATTNAPSTSAGPSGKKAPQRPSVSPYTEVNVLFLTWQTDGWEGPLKIPENWQIRRAFTAIELTSRSYGYGIKRMFCEAYADKAEITAPVSVRVPDLLTDFKQQLDKEMGRKRKDSAEQEKEKALLIIVYVGHGKFAKPLLSKGKEIIATNAECTLEISISDVTEGLSDIYGKGDHLYGDCDVLTVVDCCDGAIVPTDSTMGVESADDATQGPKQRRLFEEMVDGCGTFCVGYSPGGNYDFLLRFVDDLEQYREAWTVRERANRIEGKLKHWWTHHRRKQDGGGEGGDIVLAPVAKKAA